MISVQTAAQAKPNRLMCLGQRLLLHTQSKKETCRVLSGHAVRTVQGRPSTVVSLNSCPTVNVMWVVRTVVEVFMDSVSPSCEISTCGLEAAFTAIIRSIMLTSKTNSRRRSGKNVNTIEQMYSKNSSNRQKNTE